MPILAVELMLGSRTRAIVRGDMGDLKKQTVSWRRLAAEGAVIVVSILLAFGIEAWWDSRSDSVQARALVTALSKDFITTGERFSEAWAAYETVLGSMERILTYAEAGLVPESEWEQIDTLLSRVFYSINTFEPPMGAVETILNSGRLDLFRDQELLGELTRWTSTINEFKTLKRAGTDHFYQSLYPFFRESLNLQDLDKDIPWAVPWPHDPTEAAALIMDRSFQNAIYMHYVLYHNIGEKLHGIEEAIGHISEMTDRELN